MNEVQIESTDLVKLQRTFEDLEYRDQKSIMMSALRKAVKPTNEQAKRNIYHSVTRNLFKSIGTLVYKNEIAVLVGARKKGGFHGWHGHLVEEGTVERQYITKKGNIHKTGRMNVSKPYSHWLLRAVNSTEKEVTDTMGDEWYNSIERFHKKNGLR